jgi:hypothetical protein
MRAFRFLNNPQFDPWEVGNALFGRLTQGLKGVLIAVDWTQVGDFMILEATQVRNTGRSTGAWSCLVRRASGERPWYEHKARSGAPPVGGAQGR